MSTVHAAVVTGPDTIELREFPDPSPASDGVVVDIARCGICGTDVHAFRSGTTARPAVCGHEWVGTVSATGADVRSLAEGDRVVVATAPPCGRCGPCRAGHADHCRVAFAMTLGADPGAPPHGGFAPRLAVPAGRVVVAHPDLSDDRAAQVEPVAVAHHAVARSHLAAGDVAVVLGAGPIGLVTLQVARALGAGHVIVVEPDEHRRSLATEVGADLAVEPGDAAEAAVADVTAGLGADIAFECVGLPSAVQASVDAVRRGGAVCLLGFTQDAATITPGTWLVKEVRTTSALGYVRDDVVEAMALVADGRVSVDPLHTATIGLDALPVAFAELADGVGRQVKVLVDPCG